MPVIGGEKYDGVDKLDSVLVVVVVVVLLVVVIEEETGEQCN